MFQDLSIATRHFGQNYDNKAVINQIFPLKGHECYNISPFQLFLRSVSCLSHVQFAGFSSESLCERIMDAQSSILVTAGRSGSQNSSTRRCDVLERSGAAKMVFKFSSDSKCSNTFSLLVHRPHHLSLHLPVPHPLSLHPFVTYRWCL